MQVTASSLPSSPPKEIRTSPPIARSAPTCDATGSLPIAVTPPHSGVQPPPPPHHERQVELLHPGCLGRGDQAERREQARVDVRGEPGRPGRAPRRGAAATARRGDGRRPDGGDGGGGGRRRGGVGAAGWRRGRAGGRRTARRPPPWHAAPLMVQSAGWPAVPGGLRDEADGDRAARADGGVPAVAVTVTWPAVVGGGPSHREDRVVPAGSVKASVQPVTADVPPLVIVYWPE